jgi:hypothetical protein
MSIHARLIPGTLPVAYCYPADVQVLLNDFMNLSHAEVPDNETGVAFGPIDPGLDTPLWWNTNYNKMFFVYQGVRVTDYWIPSGELPPAPPSYMLFTEKTEAQILAWDNPTSGGSVSGAEAYTGPFWMIDHNYDGRFVVGPGNLIISATAVGVGTFDGKDQIVQEPNQVALHRHFINVGPESGDSSYLADVANESGTFKVNGAEQIRFYDLVSPEVGRTREGGGDGATPNVVHPMNIMPPYRAAYVIRRTTRRYITP